MERKLDVGNVFERIFEIYRDQFGLLVPAALIVFVPLAIVNAVILSAGSFVLAIVALALGAVAGFWYQGMVVEAAQDILDGRRDHTIGSLITSITPVIGPLVVAGLLAGLGIGIGLILLIVPGLILRTIWALIAPVIVLERAGALDSFGRSLRLVKGSGLQVFAVIVVLFLLEFVLNSIARVISDSVISYGIAYLVVGVLVAPLTALAAAVMYFELKRLQGEPGAELGARAVAATPEEQPQRRPVT
jgi:hypothetical protein